MKININYIKLNIIFYLDVFNYNKQYSFYQYIIPQSPPIMKKNK